MCQGNGLVAQLGAHHIRIVGVEGSNPFKSTNKKTADGRFFYWWTWEIRIMLYNSENADNPGHGKSNILLSHGFPDYTSCSRIRCNSNSSLQIPNFPDILFHSFRVSV